MTAFYSLNCRSSSTNLQCRIPICTHGFHRFAHHPHRNKWFYPMAVWFDSPGLQNDCVGLNSSPTVATRCIPRMRISVEIGNRLYLFHFLRIPPTPLNSSLISMNWPNTSWGCKQFSYFPHERLDELKQDIILENLPLQWWYVTWRQLQSGMEHFLGKI